MTRKLKSEIGTINLLASNPRTIRDDAFNRLCESIERDPEFLMARGVVVWQVPEILAVSEGEKNPFAGQEGQLVVIGGNQRCRAFMALGRETLEKGWVVEAKDAEGNWWSPEKAERFVLIDNNPSGIAGQDDAKKMFEKFSELSMRLAGIDFSEFQERLTAESKKTVEQKIEEGEHGEKDPALQEFIEHREETRKNLEQIDDTGFYLVVCFASREEKVEFISKSGMTGNAGLAMVDDDFYVVLVFETYEQKMEFAEKAGLLKEPEEDDPGLVYGKFCDGRAFARKFGIELKESGLHFRQRRVDSQLAEMAREETKQKTEAEMETEDRDEIVSVNVGGDEYVD